MRKWPPALELSPLHHNLNFQTKEDNDEDENVFLYLSVYEIF